MLNDTLRLLWGSVELYLEDWVSDTLADSKVVKVVLDLHEEVNDITTREEGGLSPNFRFVINAFISAELLSELVAHLFQISLL